ncbi:hypothetical protein FOZ62_012134, partial [Perkinsus olseni]
IASMSLVGLCGGSMYVTVYYLIQCCKRLSSHDKERAVNFVAMLVCHGFDNLGSGSASGIITVALGALSSLAVIDVTLSRPQSANRRDGALFVDQQGPTYSL